MEGHLLLMVKEKLLFSGSIHYPRSTPEMWPALISKAKEGGLDVIQTYVFWNIHEPQPGQYDFSGNYDLVKFLKEIQAQGLYACLRIGPYIESEWNYGGFPFWVHDVPDISYRTDNEPFKVHAKFYGKNHKSDEIRELICVTRRPYNIVTGLQTGVPWMMCKQSDAPDPVINTCNGLRYGETFTGPNSPNKPSMWTENWTSFYQVFGGEPYIRSAEDIAFHTSLFIAKNGCFVNYYMNHGGTNFGRTSFAYVITGYYDQAPLDEYGLLRQPKWGHLRDMHLAIKTCSKTLLEGKQSSVSLGQDQQAYVFQEESGGCAAFLINNDMINTATVEFQNGSYQLPPRSISILPDCLNVTFNSAKANFDAPDGDDPVALDLRTMSKGQVWINGQSIGRYWVSLLTSTETPSQTLYHILRSFLKPTDNLLVLMEETGGDPLGISVNTISISTSKIKIDNCITRKVHKMIKPKGIQV